MCSELCIRDSRIRHRADDGHEYFYFACGLPLVATRCGGPNNLVEQGTGLLVEVDDAEDLARGVEEVLKTYAHYDRRAIRRRAREKYDYRQVAARIYGVYKTVLKV